MSGSRSRPPKSPKGVEETPVVTRPISPNKISEIIALSTAELKNKDVNQDVIEIIISNYKERLQKERIEWAKKTKSKEKPKTKSKEKPKIINKSRIKE